MSHHSVEVVEVKLEPHPAADLLSIVRVKGFTVCVRTQDWKDGDLGAYVEPDSLVPTDRDEFAFLKREGRKMERIRVKKLRGIISMGLLVPAPFGSKVGDDVMEQLGVRHYEPAIDTNLLKGNNVNPPKNVWDYRYDLQNWRKYNKLFKDSEPVIVTEKVHGCSAKYTFSDDKFYCGSRTCWKDEEGGSVWWTVANRNPWIKEFCQNNPNLVLYGEVYGYVQNLRYGHDKGQYSFRAFDILKGTEWISVEEIKNQFSDLWNNYWVPVLYEGPYNEDIIMNLAEGESLIPDANNIREGVVIQPKIERTESSIGRVKLKLISNAYLEKDF